MRRAYKFVGDSRSRSCGCASFVGVVLLCVSVQTSIRSRHGAIKIKHHQGRCLGALAPDPPAPRLRIPPLRPRPAPRQRTHIPSPAGRLTSRFVQLAAPRAWALRHEASRYVTTLYFLAKSDVDCGPAMASDDESLCSRVMLTFLFVLVLDVAYT